MHIQINKRIRESIFKTCDKAQQIKERIAVGYKSCAATAKCLPLMLVVCVVNRKQSQMTIVKKN